MQRFRFTLGDLFLLTTLVAVASAIGRMSPGLGWVSGLTLPIMVLRTRHNVRWLRSRFHPVTWQTWLECAMEAFVTVLLAMMFAAFGCVVGAPFGVVLELLTFSLVPWGLAAIGTGVVFGGSLLYFTWPGRDTPLVVPLVKE